MDLILTIASLYLQLSRNVYSHGNMALDNDCLIMHIFTCYFAFMTIIIFLFDMEL